MIKQLRVQCSMADYFAALTLLYSIYSAVLPEVVRSNPPAGHLRCDSSPVSAAAAIQYKYSRSYNTIQRKQPYCAHRTTTMIATVLFSSRRFGPCGLSASLLSVFALAYYLGGGCCCCRGQREEEAAATTATAKDPCTATAEAMLAASFAASTSTLPSKDGTTASSGSTRDGDFFGGVSFALHRNGEPDPCGAVVASASAAEAFREALGEMDLCERGEGAKQQRPQELDKYQLETLLTTMFANDEGLRQQDADGGGAPLCGSTDNATAASAGLRGFCDMGPERTVVQNDHDKLVLVPPDPASDIEEGSLPCRFYTREGVRIDSLSALASLVDEARKSSSSSDCTGGDAKQQQQEGEEGTCGNNASPSPSPSAVVHLYAVPAGRVFMFAPAYIGERFVLEHMKDDMVVGGKPLVLEVISVNPRVFELYDFFSIEEGNRIVERAVKETSKTHGLHRSTTGSVGGSVFNRRTSENAWDTSGPDAKAIKRRCMKFLGFDEYWESHTDGLQVRSSPIPCFLQNNKLVFLSLILSARHNPLRTFSSTWLLLLCD